MSCSGRTIPCGHASPGSPALVEAQLPRGRGVSGGDREVASNVLPEAVAQDADRLVRFEREPKAIAALSHPNILAIWPSLYLVFATRKAD